MKKIITIIILVSTLSSSFAQLPAYVNNDSLVGWWPFTGNANDVSVNANNGTVTGASLVNDRLGNPQSAYSFSDYLHKISTNYNSSFDYSGDITMAAWIFPKGDKLYNSWQSIIYKGFQNNLDHECYLAINYTFGGTNNEDPTYYKKLLTGRNRVTTTGGNKYIYSGDSIFENKWQHVIVSIKKDTVKFYLNGKFIGCKSNENYFTIPHFSIAKSFTFGNTGNTNSPYSFNGFLDDIGIWKRALTDREIKNLYRNCILEIINHPKSQSSPLNSDVYMTIKANEPDATYQWQTNTGFGFQNITDAGQYSGSNKDTLFINGLNSINNNQLFRCIVNTTICTDTSNIAKLTIGSKSNLNDITSANEVFLFPNPSNNILKVKFINDSYENLYVIRDCFGRIVKSGELLYQDFEITLDEFSNGTYFFQIGNYFNKKFVVIKN